jgi:hypothetical protein
MTRHELGTHRHRDELEARLRDALHARAGQAAPGYRLDAILEEAGTADGTGRALAGRWLIGLAAAACVVALALMVPGLLGGSGPDVSPAVPAATPTTAAPTPEPTASPTGEATATDAPTDAPTAGPTAQPTAEPTVADEPPVQGGRLAALPVYLVAHIGDDLRMVRLYREWVNHVDVPHDADVETRVRGAVELALAASAPNTDGYLQTWQGVTVEDVAVTDSRITLTLSGPGPRDVDDETARISVQQLVWTAQGAVGRGPVPVRFSVADGSGAMFGRLATDRDYNRPSSDRYYEDLAPIWVNSPTRGEVVDGADVLVTGEATVFEGAFQWELLDDSDGSVVDSGSGQASAGGPARGTYEIRLGDLGRGDYAIRVFELSMEDGVTVSAERTIPFTVR